jgi:hypothetical protein
MPDPGEPHWPRQEEYASFEEFAKAVNQFVDHLNDPTGAKAMELIAETERFLKERP